MKKQTLFLILAFSASAIGLTGCANNAQTGAVIGSLVGAGIGKSTSNHRDKRAVVGAVLGGLVGASIGQDQDARNAAARGYNTNTATTTQYSNGSNANVSASHTHGNRSHTHDGATANHSHNGGVAASNTNNTQQTVQREVIYVERPYYPATSTVIIGGGYRNYYPRRHYRQYNRHRVRSYNRRYHRH